MNIVTLGASLRRESLNVRLNQLISERMNARGHSVTVLRLADLDSPTYNGDDDAASGLPAGAAAFKAALAAADAYVLTSPEYNFSMPGGLKNLVDWVSRGPSQPFMGKPGFLASASPSLVGGNRGLWALRVPLESLGSPVFPRMFSLAQANQHLRPEGLVDERSSGLLDAMIDDFLAFAAPR